MFQRRPPQLCLPEHRGPLRVMFVHTEVVVGGAETLLAEIIRHLDRDRFLPELCCLKRLATLGELLAREVPTHVGLLQHKYDLRVLGRLTRLLRERSIDAVVTVGTGGDRMFWGRLAGWRAQVPVILSSLHSTGYPQTVERLNRLLAPITDGFIGCARMHSQYLVEGEGCPPNKVFTIYNGVDLQRFQPAVRNAARQALGLPRRVPVAGIVAALRPEKQHGLLLDAWRLVVDRFPEAVLLVVGDGPERPSIEQRIEQLRLTQQVRLLGMRHDVPQILTAMNVKVLSSRMEANPASTLEAAACGLPAVAPRVGSLPETIRHGETGWLYPAGDHQALAEAVCELFADPRRAESMGAAAREWVCQRFSMASMVRGYEMLIEGIYRAACAGSVFRPEQFDQLTAPTTSSGDGPWRVPATATVEPEAHEPEAHEPEAHEPEAASTAEG